MTPGMRRGAAHLHHEKDSGPVSLHSQAESTFVKWNWSQRAEHREVRYRLRITTTQ